MLFTTKFSLSNIHVRLTAKGLLRNLQLLSGCKRNTVVFCAVDKNKARPNVRNLPQQNQHQVNRQHDHDPAAPDHGAWGAERNQAQSEENAKTIQGLKDQLRQSNRRFEGLCVILQHCLAEHEDSLTKCVELSQELVKLREELANSSQTCERLEWEKEELQKMREQHRRDLAELEERLRVFYADEWEKVHQVYQEKADKYKAQMEQQLENLRSKHEVLRKDMEASHVEKMESIKQQHEHSLEELRKAHDTHIQTLDKMLKETEVNLSGQVEELKTENFVLNEKLKVAEDLRKEMAAEAQDSHTLYLEQELDSLKVVLDMKSKQLHQQDQKLMEMDKMLEKNEKLDKSLQRVQRENEDLKARMDRHISLSRQLSTEQAMLQENLHKESKENKRLSRENEELLWKLHNGDLGLSRKASPTTPSLPLQSP